MKLETTMTLCRVGRPAKLTNQASRALVREVTRKPPVTTRPEWQRQWDSLEMKEERMHPRTETFLKKPCDEPCRDGSRFSTTMTWSKRVFDCSWVAQLKPGLKPYRTSVGRPEDCRSKMFPFQSDGADLRICYKGRDNVPKCRHKKLVQTYSRRFRAAITAIEASTL